MENQKLHSLWQKGQQQFSRHQNLSKMEIEAYIKPKVKKSSLGIKFNLSFYTIMAIAAFIILAINSIYFITQPIILLFNLTGMIISAFLVYYGWFSYKRFRETESGTEDLSSELRKKIDFYSRIYERWMWFIPTITLVLIFALNTLVDHENGTFKINKPLLFIGINIFIFTGIYLINKVSQRHWLREIKDYLNDLDSQLLEGTLKMESRKKKFAWLLLLIFVILTAFLILGIIMAL